MKIFIIPNNSSENKYIDIMISNLKAIGGEIVTKNDIKKNLLQALKIKCFILNWYENFPNNGSYLNDLFKYIKKVMIILFLRLLGKKIIWVVHNRTPHDTKNQFPKKIMEFMYKFSNGIIVHSKETIKILSELNKDKTFLKKVYHVPHPNYIGAYAEGAVENKSEDTLKLLFIGRVQPYKNVELLIKAFGELNLKKCSLTIAGNPKNEQYKEEITKLAKSYKNIDLILKFIDDNSITSIIKQNDIVILPYDLKSSLNSGTILLAFSNKKTVISPLIGTLKDFKDKSFFYSYEYDNESEHENVLKEMILKAYNDFKENPNTIVRKGKEAYSNVLENNSNELIQKELKKILYK